jgi:hypothetical protein
MTNKTTAKTLSKPKSVAEYIDMQIHICGKKQLEIAQESGFEKPNIVTMIKQGKTKLPLDKIGKFAKAIEVDPVFLYRLCMTEYFPDTWNEIQRVLNQPIITLNEYEMIECVREANQSNPRLDEKGRLKLADLVQALK